MEPFLGKAYRPMLIGREGSPFDSEDFFYELKLDGVRCLAYAGDGHTRLVSRSGRMLVDQFPELAALHESVSGACVLDGELVVLKDGVPDFASVKERALTTTTERIPRMAAKMPVVFVTFDLLYRDGKEIINEPLTQRRAQLEAVVTAGDHFVLSQAVEEQGRAFFEAVKDRGLEGIIAKRKDSRYYPGKRTSDWVKCKNVLEDDFIICGYIPNKNNTVSLVLGQYGREGELVYRGHAVLGISREDFTQVERLSKVKRPAFSAPLPSGNEHVVWVELRLVCRVVFTNRTDDGLLRHPVYKDMRIDKRPEEATALQE